MGLSSRKSIEEDGPNRPLWQHSFIPYILTLESTDIKSATKNVTQPNQLYFLPTSMMLDKRPNS